MEGEHAADLEQWLDVADQCGWNSYAAHRQVRRRLYAGVGLGSAASAHWIAMTDGRAVGMASAFLAGDVVEMCGLAVLEAERRRGVGRMLLENRLRWASRAGAITALSAGSPDGWQLYSPLGFPAVPVVPDVCFYLPLAERR